jgi:hypothetical protein
VVKREEEASHYNTTISDLISQIVLNGMKKASNADNTVVEGGGPGEEATCTLDSLFDGAKRDEQGERWRWIFNRGAAAADFILK